MCVWGALRAPARLPDPSPRCRGAFGQAGGVRGTLLLRLRSPHSSAAGRGVCVCGEWGGVRTQPLAHPPPAGLTLQEDPALLPELRRLPRHLGVEDPQLVQLVEVQARRAQRRLRHLPEGEARLAAPGGHRAERRRWQERGRGREAGGRRPLLTGALRGTRPSLAGPAASPSPHGGRHGNSPPMARGALGNGVPAARRETFPGRAGR